MKTMYGTAVSNANQINAANKQRNDQLYANNKQIENDYNAAAIAYESGNGYDNLSSGAKSVYDRQVGTSSNNYDPMQDHIKKEREDMGFFERAGHTLGDFLGHTTMGVLKFGENIMDVGATIFGADEDWIATDHVDGLMGDALREGTRGSYMYDNKVGSIARDVSTGVGQMLPSVLISAIPYVGPALGKASFITSAAGGGMERAFADGASRGEALVYGGLSGGLEGLIESVSGPTMGMGKSLISKLGKGSAKATAKTGGLATAKKVAGAFVGEGLEEVTSDLADPLLSSIYKGEVDYSETSAQSLANTFLVGGLTGSVMGGGQALARKASPTMDIRTKMAEIEELNKGIDNSFASGKITQKQRDVARQDIAYLSNSAQTKFLKQNSTKQASLAGTLSAGNPSFMSGLGLQQNEGGGYSAVAMDNQPSAPLDNRYYSPSLMGKEKAIQQGLAQQGTKVYSGELNNIEKANYNEFLRNQNKLAERGGRATKIVLSEKSPKFNAYLDGDVIVLGKDTLADGSWRQHLIHEQGHFAENTKQHRAYIDNILSETDTSEKNSIDDRILKSDYGITQEDIDTYKDARATGTMTNKHRLYEKEFTAMQGEVLFGDKSKLDRLAVDKPSVVVKMYRAIKDKLAVAKEKTPEEKQAKSKLQHQERLFAKALDRAGASMVTLPGGVKYSMTKTFDEQVDDVLAGKHNENMSVLVRENTPQILLDIGLNQLPMLMDAAHVKSVTAVHVVKNDHNHDLQVNMLKKLPQLLEKPVMVMESMSRDDSIVILTSELDKENRPIIISIAPNNNKWTNKITIEAMIGSYGKSNEPKNEVNKVTSMYGRNGFNAFIKNNINEDSVLFWDKKKSQELFRIPGLQLPHNLDKLDSNTIIRKFAPKVNINEKNIKFSLKDSNGKLLSKQQIEFFKDSKVLDSNGNLEVCYHGTESEFTVFDISKLGKNGTDEGKGFYFTNKESIAKSYAIENKNIIKSYLNIVKPLSTDSVTITKDKLRKLIKVLDKDGSGYLSNYGDVKFDGYDNVLNDAVSMEYDNSDNDVELISGIINADKNSIDKVYKTLKDVTGYDGVIVKGSKWGGDQTIYIAFDSSQVKLTSNSTPTISKDIRYSKKYNVGSEYNDILNEKINMGKGAEAEVTARHAGNTMLKAVKKFSFDIKGAKHVLIYDNKKSDYIAANIKRAIDGLQNDDVMLFENMIDHIVNSSTVISKDDSTWLKANKGKLIPIRELMKSYKGNIKITDSIKDMKGVASEYISSTGSITITDMKKAFEKHNITITGKNNRDRLEHMISVYNRLKKGTVGDKLSDTVLSSRTEQLKVRLREDILVAIDGTSELNMIDTYMQSVNKYIRETKALKGQYNAKTKAKYAELKEAKSKIGIEAKIKVELAKIKEIAKGEHKGLLNDSELKQVIEGIARISIPLGIGRTADMISVLKGLEGFYNNLYKDTDNYNEHMSDIMRDLIYRYDDKPDVKMTDSGDLAQLHKILRGVKYMYSNYNKISYKGELIEVSDVAGNVVSDMMRSAANYNVGSVRKNEMKIISSITDPRSIFTAVSGSIDGAGWFMDLFENYGNSSLKASKFAYNYIDKINDYIKEHKYSSDKRTVKVKTIDVPVDRAMYITMLYEAGGKETLQDAGGTYVDTKGNAHSLSNLSEADIADIVKQYTKGDLQMINKYWQILEASTKDKVSADLANNGYSMVIKKNKYIPILREASSIRKDYTNSRELQSQVNASSPDFNKHRNKHARNKIHIESIHDVVGNYLVQLGQYSEMMPALRNISSLLNAYVEYEGKKIPLKQYINDNVWSGFEAYFKKMVTDVQRTGYSKGDTRKISMASVEDAFVKSVLGANVKTVVSQLAGLPMATAYINPQHLMKAMLKKTDMAEYTAKSDMAFMREYTDVIAKASGVEGKVGSLGKFFMSGISNTDKWMIRKIYLAAKMQIEHKVGRTLDSSNSNPKDWESLVELFEKTVRHTQSNDSVIEKSNLQRHDNALMRIFAKFSSDSVKQASLLTQASIMMGNAKRAGDTVAQTKARKLLARKLNAVVMSNLMYVAIGMLFNYLLDRKDKEGESLLTAKEFGLAFVQSMIGMLPIVRDFTSYLVDGYEIEHYTYSMINDFLEGTKGMLDMGIGAAGGDKINEKDFVYNSRKFAISIASLFGLPVKNIEKYSLAMAKALPGIDKPSFYYEAVMFGATSKKLSAAIAKGDDEQSLAILDVMLRRDKASADISDDALKVMLELYKKNGTIKGYSFNLPVSTKSEISYTVDGVLKEKTLSAAEYKKFENTYSNAATDINKLVNTSAFKNLSDKEKASLIERVYDYYYKLAKGEAVGELFVSPTQKVFGDTVGVGNMSMFIAQINAIDNKGKHANYRIQQVEKLMRKYNFTYEQKQLALLIAGYKPSSPYSVINLIRRSKLSIDDKNELINSLK